MIWVNNMKEDITNKVVYYFKQGRTDKQIQQLTKADIELIAKLRYLYNLFTNK